MFNIFLWRQCAPQDWLLILFEFSHDESVGPESRLLQHDDDWERCGPHECYELMIKWIWHVSVEEMIHIWMRLCWILWSSWLIHLMNDATGSTYLCSPDRKIFDMFKLFPVCDQVSRWSVIRCNNHINNHSPAQSPQFRCHQPRKPIRPCHTIFYSHDVIFLWRQVNQRYFAGTWNYNCLYMNTVANNEGVVMTLVSICSTWTIVNIVTRSPVTHCHNSTWYTRDGSAPPLCLLPG